MCRSLQFGPVLSYLLVVELGPLLLYALFAVAPSVRLLRRLGVSRVLAACSVLPVLGPAILLWAIAYLNWPKAPSA